MWSKYRKRNKRIKEDIIDEAIKSKALFIADTVTSTFLVEFAITSEEFLPVWNKYGW